MYIAYKKINKCFSLCEHEKCKSGKKYLQNIVYKMYVCSYRTVNATVKYEPIG